MHEAVLIRLAEPADGPAILDIWQSAIDAGELRGFEAPEAAYLCERLSNDRTSVVVAEEQGGIVGFLHDLAHVLVVRTASRRHGIGREIVAGAESLIPRSEGQRLLLWRPENFAGAGAFLEAIGFGPHSSLWQLELTNEVPVPRPIFPDDLELWSVAQIKIADYVDLFNAAFANHPTPITLTREIVEWTRERPDYDPASIVILAERSTGRPVGFCRISTARGTDDAGEIRFVGVLPEWRGRGLGRALLNWGIERLRASGCPSVQLTVEGENDSALGLYLATGFRQIFEWPRFARTGRAD